MKYFFKIILFSFVIFSFQSYFCQSIFAQSKSDPYEAYNLPPSMYKALDYLKNNNNIVFSEEEIKEIVQYVIDPNPDPKLLAIRFLAQKKDPRATQDITKTFHDSSNIYDKLYLILVLGEIGDPQVDEIVLDWLNQLPENEQLMIIFLQGFGINPFLYNLSGIGGEKVENFLLEIYKGIRYGKEAGKYQEELKIMAVIALARMNNEMIYEYLLNELKSQPLNDQFRGKLILALSHYKNPEAVDILSQIANNEMEISVNRTAAQGKLGYYTPGSK